MSKKLANQVAVVTGASKGIGAEIARELAKEGAAVVVNYSASREHADRVVADITKAGGRAVAVQANIAKKADIERLFTETKKAFGRVDVLVNNAGIYEAAPVGEITEDNFHRQFNLNVLGLILASQEAVKYFGPEAGRIINISSVVATYSMPNTTVYNATKAAVDSVTRTMAKELGPKKIRVNSVNPGMVETEGLHASGFIASSKDMASITPLGRIGQPQDIAPAVVFLASGDSSWITGETFYVSGGVR